MRVLNKVQSIFSMIYNPPSAFMLTCALELSVVVVIMKKRKWTAVQNAVCSGYVASPATVL